MINQNLTISQKRLDIDIWIISLITFGVFTIYSLIGNQLMSFVKNNDFPIIYRLLLISGIQYGVAGLGTTIVCILRKEKFTQFGLTNKNIGKTIVKTIICFLPSICYIVASGQFNGYHPFFSIVITRSIIASGFPYSIVGMFIIVIVWGFFEGFNYVIISDKINKRYPSNNQWLDYGAINCAIICLLFHPFTFSFWGIIEIVTTFIAIYGMLMVKKNTGNAWGCIFAFCFIWNAI